MSDTGNKAHQERSEDIRWAAAKVAGARDLLYENIVEARQAGMSLREIAKYAGMSHEQVRRLIQPRGD